MHTGHSFGGSAMDRYVFDFETDMGGDAGATAGDVDAGATADTGVTEPSAAAPETVAAEAPAWTGPSQQDWDQVTGALSWLAENTLGNGPAADTAAGDQEPPSFDFDPFSDNPGEQLASIVSQVFQREFGPVLSPLAADHDRQRFERGYQTGMQVIDGFTDLGVDFDDDTKDIAFTLAEPLLQQYTQQYGSRPGLGQAALRQTAERLAGIVKAAEKRGEEKYLARLRDATGGTTEPGIAGAAAATEEPTDSYDEVIRRWDSRQRHKVEAHQT